MRCPGDGRPNDHVDDRHRRDRAKQQPQARDILVRRQDGKKLRERNQDQPKADPDAPEIVGAGDAAAAEHHHPDQDEERRHPRDVERQHLHDQGRADIGAEHRGEPGYEIDQSAGGEAGNHQPRRGAALQHRGDPQPGEKRLYAVAQRGTEDPPQIRAERALDPALDHVHAPEQECDRSGEVDQSQGSVHRCLPAR